MEPNEWADWDQAEINAVAAEAREEQESEADAEWSGQAAVYFTDTPKARHERIENQ